MYCTLNFLSYFFTELICIENWWCARSYARDWKQHGEQTDMTVVIFERVPYIVVNKDGISHFRLGNSLLYGSPGHDNVLGSIPIHSPMDTARLPLSGWQRYAKSLVVQNYKTKIISVRILQKVSFLCYEKRNILCFKILLCVSVFVFVISICAMVHVLKSKDKSKNWACFLTVGS